MTAVASKAAGAGAKTGLDRGVMAVFAGLMLGSLVASLNMTLVAPALPTIVAELGGLADYSWIPISAMLASTIVVPVAGKLSDIYGRKPLYMTGIVVFAVGSALSGMAPNFWFLVFARFVQGAGMGFIMPLSQAIIGDIISPHRALLVAMAVLRQPSGRSCDAGRRRTVHARTQSAAQARDRRLGKRDAIGGNHLCAAGDGLGRRAVPLDVMADRRPLRRCRVAARRFRVGRDARA
ncbi:MAG: MFS transporter [Chloroflexi bacterium]|nr:MAG: MFS transporter [Chloroflexota bacterium]